jgi:small-conductance mechanosensitive channel
MIEEFFGTVENFAVFLGILLGTLLFAFIFRKLYTRFILRSTLVLRNDPTNYKFLKHAIVGVIYVVGLGFAIYRVEAFKDIATTLLTTAGILAVAVGFASQAALSNVISGIFIVIFKPFRVNDRIRLRTDLMGTIEDITLRHVVIRDFENRRIIIPNTIISDEVVTNFDIKDERVCKWIDIGISYGSDIDLARRIMREEVLKHPLRIEYRTEEDILEGKEEVPVRVISLGDFSVNMRAWAWAQTFQDGFILEKDLLESIKKRFDREGVEIPFPYRTIVMKDQKSDPVPEKD